MRGSEWGSKSVLHNDEACGRVILTELPVLTGTERAQVARSTTEASFLNILLAVGGLV